MASITNLYTDFGTALSDLHDLIIGQSGYTSLYYDETTYGEGVFAVSTPAAHDDTALYIYMTANGVYTYTGAESHFTVDGSGNPDFVDDSGTTYRFDNAVGTFDGSISRSTAVRMWAYAGPSGFSFLLKRAETDGLDSAVMTHYELVDKFFPYSHATASNIDALTNHALMYEDYNTSRESNYQWHDVWGYAEKQPDINKYTIIPMLVRPQTSPWSHAVYTGKVSDVLQIQANDNPTTDDVILDESDNPKYTIVNFPASNSDNYAIRND